MMQCLSASMTPLMFSTSITKLRMPSRGRPPQTLHTWVGFQRGTAQWDKRDVALRNIMSYLTHHDASWRIMTVSKWDNNGGEHIYQLQLASVATRRHTLWRWFGATFDTFEVGHLRAMSAWQAPRCRKLSNCSLMFLALPCASKQCLFMLNTCLLSGVSQTVICVSSSHFKSLPCLYLSWSQTERGSSWTGGEASLRHRPHKASAAPLPPLTLPYWHGSIAVETP
jgi:hypothetical protein